MVGETLTHYRILDRLGEGGMGVVYRARDERLERDVAIKVLRDGALADGATRSRFRDEALALSRLNHPGIATIYDFDQEQDHDFLVMEYVQGPTLAERLAESPLEEPEARELGAQIADALGAAHEQGVVHRDLKPGNVVVTPRGQVKVLDFGLAKLRAQDSDSTRSRTGPLLLAGTLAYMAPEQLMGQNVDGRTDLYALGVLLFEMATGRRPHEQPIATALMYAIVNTPPPAPRRARPALTSDFERTILRALEKSPERRFATAAEIAAALRRTSVAGDSGGATLPAVRFDAIAVLPFANLSGDPAQEFFADGMTESLITSLAQIGALRVISHTSAMHYKGAGRPLPEIARGLGVDAIVEGSVLRAGERVRISARLTDAIADHLLWARSYEGAVGDVLSLQSEVARAVADEIRITLTPLERERLSARPAVDPRAHEAYLHGRVHWNRRAPGELYRGIEYFNRAIALDPRHALSYAGLADSYNILGDMDALPQQEAAPKARAAVARALEIDPGLGEAYTSLGFARVFFDWDFRGGREAFEKALELSPSYATGHQWYAEFLASQQEFDRAIFHAHRARELDPLSPILGTTVGDIYFYARRYKEAEAWLGRTVAMDPTFPHPYNDLGRLHTQMGNYNKAIEFFEKAMELSRGEAKSSVGLGYAMAQAGRRAEALAILDGLMAERERRYVSAHAIAAIHIGLGDKNVALDWIERAAGERDRALVWIRVHPRLDPLRDHPRFQAVVKRVIEGA